MRPLFGPFEGARYHANRKFLGDVRLAMGLVPPSLPVFVVPQNESRGGAC